jgi:hypothetical protein
VTGTTISVVLRVLAGPAAQGRLVGQVEVVDTGEVVALSETDDLAALVQRLSAGSPPA